MPRISSNAKKIFDLIIYQADINEANEVIENLDESLDKAFGKVWLAYYFLCFYKINSALE